MKAASWWPRLAEWHDDQYPVDVFEHDRIRFLFDRIEQLVTGRPAPVDLDAPDPTLRQWPIDAECAGAPVDLSPVHASDLPRRVHLDAARVLYLRALADKLDTYADGQPLGVARSARAEARTYRDRADEIDQALDQLPTDWADAAGDHQHAPVLVPIRLRRR